MSYEHNRLIFELNHAQILNELSKNNSSIDTKIIDKLKHQIRIIESFSSNKNRYFLLFDLAHFVPIYVSKNIINQNYTPDFFCRLKLIDGLKSLYPPHINIGRKYLQCRNKFYTHLQTHPYNNDEFLIGGIKFKDKRNRIKTFVIKGRLIVQKNETIPRLCFLEIEELTKLWKGDNYWIQYSIQRNNQSYKKIYYSSKKKKEAQHLLSPQELKIIKLVAQNKTSSEIAKQLNVNIETIKKHRKNMLAKTQTKDLTSLIQILIICDMI